ncbi:MAG: hypothetical protein WCK38_00520 [Candidatus Omnitrophota bacterium]
MREVIFKNLTSLASRKKDIVLKEVFEKDGVMAKTERRCFYFIRRVDRLSADDTLDKWITSQGAGGSPNSRRFHILKEHNDSINEDKVICRIEGEFFAVVNMNIFTIGFLHYFKVRFERKAMAK